MYIVIYFAHTTLFHKYTGVFGFVVNKRSSRKTSIHKRFVKLLKSGLKSALFACCSVTFSHQYHTLDMARKGKKSVISHFYSARSQKHIDPLIFSNQLGVMISEQCCLHFDFFYFAGMLFRIFIIVNADQQHITCIFTDKTGIAFFFDLLDGTFCRLIPFELNDHRRKRCITLWKKHDICNTVSRWQFLNFQIVINTLVLGHFLKTHCSAFSTPHQERL